ncbi:MAG: NIL domain-containing protein [Elusimicrobiota bacterium]
MISRKIVLHFPKRTAEQPVIFKLVKDFGLEFNILKANINPDEEGLMVMELSGEKKNYEKGIKYLQGNGVTIQPLSQDIKRNEKRCTHCGVCVPICPTACFSVEPATRMVNFDDAKCITCEICVKICPPQAMELHF